MKSTAYGHYGCGDAPELVTSFKGEGAIDVHTRYQPEVQMGSVWTDLRDKITGAASTAATEAATGVIEVISDQPTVQESAKEASFKYLLENYWKQALIGTAIAAAGFVIVSERLFKKRKRA